MAITTTYMREALAATTAAANSDELNLASAYKVPATVHVYGLAGAEVAPLEIKRNDGTWETVNDGADVEFTATVQDFSIASPGIYRVAKPLTAGAAGVGWLPSE